MNKLINNKNYFIVLSSLGVDWVFVLETGSDLRRILEELDSLSFGLEKNLPRAKRFT